MPTNTNNEVDRLYGLLLREFVSARNELAKRLREEGRTDKAADVASLQKPAVAVWAVNQLARHRRRDVDLLLDAGHRLRAAQAESQPEKARQAFERAREAEREAIRRLRKAAEDLLQAEQGTASSAMLERVLATLRAAAVTEEGRELLARGRLTEELSTTGFDLAATLIPERGAAPRTSHPRPEGKREQVASARAALSEARQRQGESERRLREADRRAIQARRALDAAEVELDEARAEAAEATSAVKAAEGALERAKRSR